MTAREGYPVVARGVGFRRISGEGVALTPATSKVIVLNDSACRVLELADGTRSAEEILDLLAAEYEGGRGVIQNDVATFLDRAIAAGLIELRNDTRET